MEVYLDNNSTTKVDKEVLKTMMPYFTENYGNPSSIHKFGQKNRKVLEEARENIAKLLKIKSNELIFTGSGTESNNLAIRGVAEAYRDRGNNIITSTIEHPSVLNTCKELEKEGFEITYISVDKNGKVNLEELKNAIKTTTILISIMHANNEIGTIQDINKIGEIAKKNKILFHSDVVQSMGKFKINPKENNIDLLSFSGHKFYGPKGIGGLYIRNGVKLKKVIAGGHQERNRRPGTENVPAIIGMAKAIEIAYENMNNHNKKEKELRDYLESELIKRIPEVKVNAESVERLPGTLSFTIKYVEGESILLNLDMKGIAVSSGSACASGSLDPSHVILAIGVPIEDAHGTLRFSIGKYNTKEEIDYVIKELPPIVEKIRSMSPFWNEDKENN
ncbi:MAG: cysteine desulfurase NifS [Fusobacteriia bacterium 4572_132]|nr:MAG: cysteine desulfurase NifS [Fusobacteriia bacterium 4572_132]